MEATLLINLDDILHYTSISGNVDILRVNPNIFNAQILYLEPILGSDLYNKLITLVDNGDITGSTNVNYKTLLDTYVTPSIVFHTMGLYVDISAFQIADGGVFQYQPTNANPSPYSDIDRISGKYKVIGSKYDEKLVTYLCKNSSLFPEYTTNSGLVKKSEVVPKVGWYLGRNHTYSKLRI